jgi:hypothetical protein
VEEHRDELNDKDGTETDDKQYTNRFYFQVFSNDDFLKLYKSVSEGPVGLNERLPRKGCLLHILLHDVHIFGLKLCTLMPDDCRIERNIVLS